MIEKLKSLLGDDEVPPPRNSPPVEATANHFADGEYITTEAVRKGDSDVHTVRASFKVASYQYDAGDTVAGVLRSYDDSVTIEDNVRNHIADTGQMPVDGWTGNPSPDHILRAIALVPGEFIEDATPSQYLAVPIWEDEA